MAKQAARKRLTRPPRKVPKEKSKPLRGYIVVVEGDLNSDASYSVIAQGVPEALGPSILRLAAKKLEESSTS